MATSARPRGGAERALRQLTVAEAACVHAAQVCCAAQDGVHAGEALPEVWLRHCGPFPRREGCCYRGVESLTLTVAVTKGAAQLTGKSHMEVFRHMANILLVPLREADSGGDRVIKIPSCNGRLRVRLRKFF
eukprot:COSAG02_NODE_28_length_51367_cov_70.053932_43_plen_132_part_00